MKVKPSSMIKRRYLLIEDSNKKEIEKIILDYLGILGYAKSIPQFIQKGENLILAVERSQLTNIRAAFEISDSNAKIIRVSGTIKGLKIKDKN